DAEFKKAEEAARAKKTGSSKIKKQSPLPTGSPFELSEADLAGGKGPKTPGLKTPAPQKEESSDEFTLMPMGGDSSEETPPLKPGSGEVPLLRGDDEVSLGELTGAAGGSGINLQSPADSGISLEQSGSDEIEFELTLDPSDENRPLTVKADKPAGPKTSLGKGQKPPSEEESGFELSLQDDSSVS